MVGPAGNILHVLVYLPIGGFLFWLYSHDISIEALFVLSYFASYGGDSRIDVHSVSLLEEFMGAWVLYCSGIYLLFWL